MVPIQSPTTISRVLLMAAICVLCMSVPAVSQSCDLTGTWTGTLYNMSGGQTQGTWQLTQDHPLAYGGTGTASITGTQVRGGANFAVLGELDTPDDNGGFQSKWVIWFEVNSEGYSADLSNDCKHFTYTAMCWYSPCGPFTISPPTMTAGWTGDRVGTKLIVNTPLLPPGVATVNYGPVNFTASGGVPPFSWSIASGSVPSGVSLDTTGVLSGVPTQTGSFKFAVQVTDSASNQATSKTVTLNVIKSVAITPNVNCKPALLAGICSANILFADGAESTDVAIATSPAASVPLSLSATVGTLAPSSVTTDFSGKASATYTSTTLTPGSTTTATDAVSSSISGVSFPSTSKIFNFAAYDFHQSSTTDTQFTDTSTLDSNGVETFFSDNGSFLADFVLFGTNGGFVDSNGNGQLDSGEIVYLANPFKICKAPCGSIALGTTGNSAAFLFADAAGIYGVNPQVLLTTAEKENGLIGRTSLPKSARSLNFAMGCGAFSDFQSQVYCAAKTLINRFSDTTAFGRGVSYPFFFHATDGLRHYASDINSNVPVAFDVESASTYAQFRYTPWIYTRVIGGVYSYEFNWQKFGF